MNLTAPGKLVVLCIAMVGTFALLMTGHIGETPGVGLITSIVTYVLTNGVGAIRGLTTVPVFSATPEKIVEVAAKAAEVAAKAAEAADVDRGDG